MVVFELAILRMIQCDRNSKAVYIAPTKSLCGDANNSKSSGTDLDFSDLKSTSSGINSASSSTTEINVY